MPWATALFTIVFAIPLFWMLHGSIGFLLLLLVALVCWGAGWLMAFYMWHLADAVQYETGPLRPSKQEHKGEKAGDV